MSEIAMSRDQYRVAYEDDADNVRGKPFTLPAGDANHSDVITGASSPSTFAEAFAAAPASCPGCERARSVAVGLQGEVERLKATLSRVEALAEEWRWKDPGEPPAPEWEILDAASADLRRVLTGEEADHG